MKIVRENILDIEYFVRVSFLLFLRRKKGEQQGKSKVK